MGDAWDVMVCPTCGGGAVVSKHEYSDVLLIPLSSALVARLTRYVASEDPLLAQVGSICEEAING